MPNLIRVNKRAEESMDNLLHLAFEAHNDEANHHRRYEMTLGRDLLDYWTVTIRYGRCGRGGQEIRYASQSAEEIQQVIAGHLRRRRSAPKRLGCSYHLVNESVSRTVCRDDWIAPGMLQGFACQ